LTAYHHPTKNLFSTGGREKVVRGSGVDDRDRTGFDDRSTSAFNGVCLVEGLGGSDPCLVGAGERLFEQNYASHEVLRSVQNLPPSIRVLFDAL
jgi:hypothetical protein